MKKLFTIISVLIISNAVLAQIPNGDFEVWDSSAGYKMPVGWDNMYPVTNSESTCWRNAPGYTGSYYLSLNTENVTGFGIVPGLAVSGKLDPVTHLPASGFPFTSRPQVLAGAWQYMAYTSSDQGYIAILLSKWNIAISKRDTIAFTWYNLPGMVMEWKPFVIGLNYRSAATPDSAMIVLSSSGNFPLAYSFLLVDDLRFGDSATLFSPYAAAAQTRVFLFPNPAKQYAHVLYSSLTEKNVTISVSEINGRVISHLSFNASNGDNNIPIDISLLAKGLYFIKVSDDQDIHILQLIVE